MKSFIKSFVRHEDRIKYLKPSRIYYVNSANSNDDIELTDSVKNKTAEVTSYFFNSNEVRNSLTEPV